MSIEKPQSSYESMILISVKNGEEATTAIIAKFKDLVESSATLDSFEDLGVRKLAYLIEKESDAHYLLFGFTSDADFPAELARISKITDGVLRIQTIRKGEQEV